MGLKLCFALSFIGVSVFVYSCAVPQERQQQNPQANSSSTVSPKELNQFPKGSANATKANITLSVKSFNNTASVLKNATTTEKNFQNTTGEKRVATLTSKVSNVKNNIIEDIESLIKKYAICVFTKKTPCVHSTALGLLEFTAPKQMGNCAIVEVKFKPKSGKTEKDFKVIKCGKSLKIKPIDNANG